MSDVSLEFDVRRRLGTLADNNLVALGFVMWGNGAVQPINETIPNETTSFNYEWNIPSAPGATVTACGYFRYPSAA